MPASFDRWVATSATTGVFEEFRRHHTELNDLYWAFVPAASFSSYVARSSGDETPESIFHASGPDVNRLAATNSDWQRDFRNFQNWVRLGIVMSAASYFEMYIRSVVAMALLSDPYISHGAPRLMDGVKLLKLGISSDIDKMVDSCVKGEWAKRASSFRKLFGAVPPALVAEVSNLEAIRKIRNQVGHSFGREIPSVWRLVTRDLGVTERVSEKRAKEWLKVLFEVASDVDSFLLDRSIGQYELLLTYHLLVKHPTTLVNGSNEVKFLSKKIFEMRGRTPGKRFIGELISYYSQI